MFEWQHFRLETDFGEKSEPVSARELTSDVTIPFHMNGSVTLAQ